MYARDFSFKAKPHMRSEVEALADGVFSFMKSLQGFVTVHFLMSEDENEYGSFSLWETREDAEAAGEAMRSKTREALQKITDAPVTQNICEVYKPKA